MGIFSAITAPFLVIWYCTEAVVRACIPWGWRKRKDITGEIVLITGGGSGMGRLMALEFAKRNAVVVLWDANESGNRETMHAIKAFDGRVHAYTVDVTNAEEVYEIAESVKREVGDVSVLVNNAGVLTGKRLMDCPDHMIRRTMDVNVTSQFWTLKSFLPTMKSKNKGHIVTIASISGHFPANCMVDYCASKFGAVGLHSTLRLELLLEGYDGVDMTLVCPGPVSTGLLKGAKFNFMTPEYAVSKIMDAFLLNEKMLLLPETLFRYLLLKFLIPEKVVLMIQRTSGTSTGMDTFTGKKDN